MNSCELVEGVCRELGQLKLADVAGEMEESAILQLFRRDRMREFRPGDPITHCVATYEIPSRLLGWDARDKSQPPVNIPMVMARIKELRLDRLRSFLPLFEKTFRAYAGNARPEAWRAIIHKQSWLKERAMLSPGADGLGAVVVYIDASFGFEPIVNEAPEIDMGQLTDPV